VTNPSDAVLAANQAFYLAFNQRDIRAMEQVWAEKTPVSCVHPGWAPLFGRQAVMAIGIDFFGAPDPPRIEMTEPHAVVVDQTAFVVCIEHLGDATICATNVFVEEKGEWRLVHHHGGPMSSSRSSRRPAPRQMN
jgi:ketosteroid isomerase-like protein